MLISQQIPTFAENITEGMKSIETNLKEICRRKGLSLTDVANRMGTSPSNLLSSVKGNPTITKLEDIAEALQVSIAELLTKRPEKALGIVLIDGQTYQLSKPASSTVQLPSYARYDTLREEIRVFIKKCVNGAESASKMGLVDTMEVFSLVYDAKASKFLLTLSYSNGQTITSVYDKLEFCNWDQNASEDDAKWDLGTLTEEIINDIEGLVPMRLQAE